MPTSTRSALPSQAELIPWPWMVWPMTIRDAPGRDCVRTQPQGRAYTKLIMTVLDAPGGDCTRSSCREGLKRTEGRFNVLGLLPCKMQGKAFYTHAWDERPRSAKRLEHKYRGKAGDYS
eukprot:1142642-Pelagomonas_calceolata.AAC.3